MATIHCKECDAETTDRIPGSFNNGICFKCNFWHDKLEFVNDPNSVRVDGRHYFIYPDSPDSPMLGHGGQGFTIKFNDGRIVTTHNLWSQGIIPANFRERLPDNAVFMKG